MPWTISDVDSKKKGLSPQSKTRWIDIANSVLGRTGDEGQAIRVANSKTKPSSDAIKRYLNKNKGGTP